MDIKNRKVDPARQEQGAWVDEIPDWGDLRLKVRGANNTDYRRLQQSLLDELPRHKRVRGRLSQEDEDRIAATLLHETVLLDWENLSEGKVAAPFSKEAARKYLFYPEYVAFRAAVTWASNVVASEDEATAEDALGNSQSAFAGRSSGGQETSLAAT